MGVISVRIMTLTRVESSPVLRVVELSLSAYRTSRVVGRVETQNLMFKF
jgi:hypothetical protein